jgi:dTDP-4-dehydrorhamnose reductase
MGQRVLVTGITSIHGWPVFKYLQTLLPAEHLWAIRPPALEAPAGPRISALCISDHWRLSKIQRAFQPTHVVYCSGVCDLDACEDKPEWAWGINRGGAEAVAQVFGQTAKIVFLSTDLVFSGAIPPGMGYQEDDPVDPVSVVGKSFAAAERLIRGCPDYLLYRLGLPIGRSFTRTKGAWDFIDHRFRRGLPLTLFYDEIRSCIACEDIAQIVAWSLMQSFQGCYHFGGQAGLDLYSLGKRVLDYGGYPGALLHRSSRLDERNGPPRVGDIRLNSNRLAGLLRHQAETLRDTAEVARGEKKNAKSCVLP